MKVTATTVILLLTAPQLLADDTILKGIDVWETKDDGGTYVDLYIPAGFFCATSAPFSGRVTLKGVPIATDPSYVLGRTDTIVERQSDATFSVSNTAQVNGIMRAACFLGTSSITVSGCSGSTYWDVKSVAAPGQSAFAITIRRSNATATGGTFDSNVTISPRLIFTKQDSGVQRVLDQAEVQFTTVNADWTHSPGSGGVKRTSSVTVDANCDGVPETALPGTSNFAPGWSPVLKPGCSVTPCWSGVVHDAVTHRHPVKPSASKHCSSGCLICDTGSYATSQYWVYRSTCAEAQSAYRAMALPEAQAFCYPATVCGTSVPPCEWEPSLGWVIDGVMYFGCTACVDCSFL